MKIIEPYAKMIPSPGTFEMWDRSITQFTPEMGLHLIRHVEWCARISHRSEDAVTADSYKRLLESVVVKHGDWSVTEHAYVTVDAYVDRGITHEWVRHRLFAFTQESTRFVNYAKKMEPSFVCPPELNSGDEASGDILDHNWVKVIKQCEESYQGLLADGYAPQIARSVFPNALASRLVVSGNLRNWRHFFLMRTTKESHPQMKQVTIPLLEEFKRNIPILYDDIWPNMRQVDNLMKAR